MLLNFLDILLLTVRFLDILLLTGVRLFVKRTESLLKVRIQQLHRNTTTLSDIGSTTDIIIKKIKHSFG